MKDSTTKNKLNIIKKTAKGGLIALFWLAIWQLLYVYVDVPLLVPSPASVFSRLSFLVFTYAFWQNVFYTLLRIMGGFLLAVAIGTALGALTSMSRFLSDILSPVIKVIRATPVASFIILLLVWLKTNDVPLVAALLMVLPVIWANVVQGIASTDEKLLQMAKVYRLSKWTVIRTIYFPSILPYFMAASITSLGLAWKSGIAAEVLALPRLAIGRQLNNAKVYLETPDLFAWTIVIIILSIIIEVLLLKVVNRLLGRFRANEGGLGS